MQWPCLRFQVTWLQDHGHWSQNSVVLAYRKLPCVLVACQCMCFLMHGLKVCRTCHLTQWKAQLTASRLSFKCPCPCRCPHHHGLSGLQAVPQQGVLEGFTVDLLEHSNWCIQLLQKVHEVCFNGHCIAT